MAQADGNLVLILIKIVSLAALYLFNLSSDSSSDFKQLNVICNCYILKDG